MEIRGERLSATGEQALPPPGPDVSALAQLVNGRLADKSEYRDAALSRARQITFRAMRESQSLPDVFRAVARYCPVHTKDVGKLFGRVLFDMGNTWIEYRGSRPG